MDGKAGHRWKRALAGFGAALAITAGLSPAWACTASPFLTIGPTQAAEVGTQLTAKVYAATGLATGRADLRLIDNDSLAQTLASTTVAAGKDFAVPFTVPDLAGGVHYLALENGGRIVARASFEVLRAGQPQVESLSSLRQPDPHPGNGVPRALAGAGFAALGVAAVAGFGMTTSRRRRTLEITNSPK